MNENENNVNVILCLLYTHSIKVINITKQLIKLKCKSFFIVPVKIKTKAHSVLDFIIVLLEIDLESAIICTTTRIGLSNHLKLQVLF